MIGVLIALTGGAGVYLLVFPPLRTHRGPQRSWRTRSRTWLNQVGLHDVGGAELVAATATLGAGAGLVGFAVFGGLVPAAAMAACAAAGPFAWYRNRRTRRRAAADEQWPALIEEVRVRCGAAGQALPQAFLDAGLRAGEELRPTFERAQRTWALTTDFGVVCSEIKADLASASADATCEVLLVAHQLGGLDIDRRLAELAEDRRTDVILRREATAKLAGVRFARRFVLLVPAGMAAAGMSLGDGRAAFATPTGQLLAAVAIGLVVVCWIWSGRMMRLPAERRVFP
jgi:tight adherence protein B